MNKRIKKLWIKALRSGKYMQGWGTLKKGLKDDKQYCCLGVLTEIALEEGVCKTVRGHYLTVKVAKWAGLESTDPYIGDSYTASAWNDENEASFTKIADLIDTNL